MGKISDFMKRFSDQRQAFRVAKQAGRARELAELKYRRMSKPEASGKKPYAPGSIGLSSVSAAIQKDHGSILSRRERKATAKAARKPFTAYINRN